MNEGPIVFRFFLAFPIILWYNLQQKTIKNHAIDRLQAIFVGKSWKSDETCGLLEQSKEKGV